MNQDRDNLKAGIFVLVGLVLVLLVIYLLTDLTRLTEQRQLVRVYYHLSDGVQGLKNGAIVTLGDQPIGEVQNIDPYAETGGDGRIIGLTITLAIPDRFKLYWDAEIELVVPPLGTGTRLNIRSVGGRITKPGQAPLPLYTSDTTIPPAAVPDWAIYGATDGKLRVRSEMSDQELLAAYPGPTNAIPGALAGSVLVRNLATEVGIQGEQRSQIQQIIGNVAAITAEVKGQLPDMLKTGKRVLDNVEKVSEKANVALDKATETVDNVKAISVTFKERSDAWAERIDKTLDNTQALAKKARDLLDEKSPTISTALDNVKDASANLKDVTQDVRDTQMAKISAAVDKATTALENLRAASASIRDIAAGQKPVLERTLANAQLMSDQLKLLAIELRRTPWRLLHAPTEEELDTDQLYDAARSFALAAGALDSASANLKAVASQPDASGETVGGMVEHLAALFEKFKEAEKTFWEQLRARNQN